MKKNIVNKKDPKNAFKDGYFYAKRILSKHGIDEAKKFTENARLKWSKTKDFSDKKFYDGAKKAISTQIRPSYNNADIFVGAVSNSLYEAFGEPFLKKYGLENIKSSGIKYNKNYSIPCVYFGCYTDRDVNLIKRNKSIFKIIVYGGTDATKVQNLKKLKEIKNLYHVAISDYVSEDLRILNIPHKKIAITPIDHSKYNFKLEPLGKSVYIYTGSGPQAEKYGYSVYSKVQEIMPHLDFNICRFGDYSREDLINIYKDSFIGLRLTDHDGLPNTVIEMGLMGRRVIYNGGLPSGIKYNKNSEHICKIINEEHKKVGKIFPEVRDNTLRHLNNSRDWLNISYWK